MSESSSSSSSSANSAGSGYYGSLSESQQTALESFLLEGAKIRLPYYATGAGYLDENLNTAEPTQTGTPNKIIYEALRFLRARKFDVAASLEMYRAHQAWRAKWAVDSLLLPENKPAKFDLVNKIIPHQRIGFDKEGRPVVYEKLGQVDPVALMNLVSADDYLRVHIAKYEAIWAAMDQRSKETGKYVETFTLVLDLKGVKIDTGKTTGYLKLCSENDANNNPERLGKLIIINTPLLFMALWKIAQAFIDEKTKQKISIVYGSPFSDLSSVIDPSVIPSEYGGTNSENLVAFDLANLKLQDLTGQHEEEAPVQEVTIAAGKSNPYVFALNVGDTFYWYFRVSGGNDIECKVSFTPKSTGVATVVSTQKSSTDQGAFTASGDLGSGELLFELSNSYSWMTSKTLKYSVTTVKAAASSSSSSSSSPSGAQ